MRGRAQNSGVPEVDDNQLLRVGLQTAKEDRVVSAGRSLAIGRLGSSQNKVLRLEIPVDDVVMVQVLCALQHTPNHVHGVLWRRDGGQWQLLVSEAHKSRPHIPLR